MHVATRPSTDRTGMGSLILRPVCPLWYTCGLGTSAKTFHYNVIINCPQAFAPLRARVLGPLIGFSSFLIPRTSLNLQLERLQLMNCVCNKGSESVIMSLNHLRGWRRRLGSVAGNRRHHPGPARMACQTGLMSLRTVQVTQRRTE
jgi:hypothetical protein